MGGEVYLVGVWAGGDEGGLGMAWSATGREERGDKKLKTKQRTNPNSTPWPYH